MASPSGPDPWTQLVVNVGLTAVAHPMGYVKTLVQVIIHVKNLFTMMIEYFLLAKPD